MTRRDFLKGLSAVAAGCFLPACLKGATKEAWPTVGGIPVADVEPSRISKALHEKSMKEALSNGVIKIYSGSAPTSPYDECGEPVMTIGMTELFHG